MNIILTALAIYSMILLVALTYTILRIERAKEAIIGAGLLAPVYAYILLNLIK